MNTPRTRQIVWLFIYKVPEALNTFNERHAVRAIYKSTAWFLLLVLDSFGLFRGTIKCHRFVFGDKVQVF